MNTFKNKQYVNKSSQTIGFFAAQGLCPANQVIPIAIGTRARSFCRLLSHGATASGNPDSYRDTNALATALPNLFYLLSPEAFRLTFRL